MPKSKIEIHTVLEPHRRPALDLLSVKSLIEAAKPKTFATMIGAVLSGSFFRDIESAVERGIAKAQEEADKQFILDTERMRKEMSELHQRLADEGYNISAMHMAGVGWLVRAEKVEFEEGKNPFDGLLSALQKAKKEMPHPEEDMGVETNKLVKEIMQEVTSPLCLNKDKVIQDKVGSFSRRNPNPVVTKARDEVRAALEKHKKHCNEAGCTLSAALEGITSALETQVRMQVQ